MREEGGLWGSMPDTGSREQQEALDILDEYQGLLRTIILGTALQYRSLEAERCRILHPATGVWSGPQPEDMQAAASLITLCALFGFQRQSAQLAAQTARSGGVPDCTEMSLGAASIGITLIRLLRLVCSQPEPNPTARELNTLEELGEPAV